jgi:hypothetical protein
MVATSLASVRGTITMAGVMTLPLLMPEGTAFPARDLIVFLATAVILVSLVAASIGLRPLLKRMSLAPEPAEAQEENLARRAAANAAIAAMEKSQHDLLEPAAPQDVDIYAHAATRVMVLYREWLDNEGSNEEEARRLRKADDAKKVLRMAALQAQRKPISALARHNRVSDDVSRKLLREIDLMEPRCP